MARPSNTEERRAQILEGLLQVMAEHGYDGASIPLIAAKSGLAPGLVHYHFESKLAILLGLIDLLALRLRARIERRLAVAASPRARVYAFIDGHLALGSDASPAAVACWVAIGAESLREPSVRVAYRKALRQSLETLEELVGAVLRDEGRSEAALSEIAAGLMSAIHGCYQLAVAAQVAPRGFAAPTVRRMVDGLFAAQPEVEARPRAREPGEDR